MMLSMMVVMANTTNDSTAKTSALPSTVKVGFLYPKTGNLGSIGQGLMDGAQAAAYRINTSTTYGFKVQIVAADTATDGPTTATAAQTLISDGVKVIVGAASSTDTLAASAVTIPNKVVLISYASTSPAITNLNDSDYVFRDVASDAYQGKALVNLTLDEGVTNPFVLHMNNAYGNGVAQQFEAAFNTTGNKIAGDLGYDPTATSFASEVSTVQAANPDGVVMIAYTQDGAAILNQAKADGLNLKFFGTDGIADPSVTNASGLATYLTGKLFGTVPSGPYNSSTTLYSQFMSDLNSTGGSYGVYGDNVYDAILIVAAALQKAGSNDGTAIRDNLYAVAKGFKGATGADKAFNCDGEPIAQTYDFWNATIGAIDTMQARAVSFSGLGAAATAPSGNHPYTGTFITNATPGFEMIPVFAVFGVGGLFINNRKHRKNYEFLFFLNFLYLLFFTFFFFFDVSVLPIF